MKQFLLLLPEDVEKLSDLSPKEMEELANAHMNYANKLAEAGHLISETDYTKKVFLLKENIYPVMIWVISIHRHIT